MRQIPVTTKLLNVFRNNPQTLIFEGYCKNFDSVTVYNDGDSYALTALNMLGETECCIYTDKKGFINEVTAALRGKVKFCGTSAFVKDYLEQKYKFNWRTDCDLYVWNGKPLNLDVGTANVRPLDAIYAQQVSDGTPYKANVNDVLACLKKHPSASVYVDGEPVCWCLLHLEGSLGMLYTVPSFRRKGYALQVMTALTDTVIRLGNVPFAYIVEDNFASKNLAEKYNLRQVCKTFYFETEIV